MKPRTIILILIHISINIFLSYEFGLLTGLLFLFIPVPFLIVDFQFKNSCKIIDMSEAESVKSKDHISIFSDFLVEHDFKYFDSFLIKIEYSRDYILVYCNSEKTIFCIFHIVVHGTNTRIYFYFKSILLDDGYLTSNMSASSVQFKFIDNHFVQIIENQSLNEMFNSHEIALVHLVSSGFSCAHIISTGVFRDRFQKEYQLAEDSFGKIRLLNIIALHRKWKKIIDIYKLPLKDQLILR